LWRLPVGVSRSLRFGLAAQAAATVGTLPAARRGPVKGKLAGRLWWRNTCSQVLFASTQGRSCKCTYASSYMYASWRRAATFDLRHGEQVYALTRVHPQKGCASLGILGGRTRVHRGRPSTV